MQLPLLNDLFDLADLITLWHHDHPMATNEERKMLQAVLDLLLLALRSQGLAVLRSAPGDPVETLWMKPFGAPPPKADGTRWVVQCSVKCGFRIGTRLLRPETVVIANQHKPCENDNAQQP